MTIWRIADPCDYSYARASLLGTWSDDENQVRIRPLVLEWEHGSDLIGDFVWPGFGGDLVAQKSVCENLTSRFSGFEMANISMVTGNQKKKKSRIVTLPYKGPQLFEIWTTAWAHVDLDRSSVTKSLENGNLRYSVTGIERVVARWNPVTKERIRSTVAREPGAGLFLSAEDLKSASIFRFFEFPNWIMCNSQFKEFVERERYSNIRFREVGTIY